MDSAKLLLVRSILAVCGLAAFTDAHMKMGTPPPFDTPATNHEPVTQGTFPCNFLASPDNGLSGTVTNMTRGETQEMAFIGGASHGGGSCQISITYDNPPTRDSVFKVIHSIHGGCPARKHDDHIADGDSNFQGPDRYPYRIPDGIPGGDAIIAWSWISRTGGRNEFYMSCAPIHINDDEGDEAAFAALPDMFVANVEGLTDCTFPPNNFDLEYPNPGNSLDDSYEQKNLLKPTCGGGEGGAGGAPGGAPAPETAGPVSAAAAAPAATPPAVRGRRPIV